MWVLLVRILDVDKRVCILHARSDHLTCIKSAPNLHGYWTLLKYTVKEETRIFLPLPMSSSYRDLHSLAVNAPFRLSYQGLSLRGSYNRGTSNVITGCEEAMAKIAILSSERGAAVLKAARPLAS